MSAWPEAVWIVKRLQEDFDLNGQIQNYLNKLNELNGSVNILTNNFNSLENTLTNRAVTIRAAKKTGENTPNISSNETFGKGAIWFIIS